MKRKTIAWCLWIVFAGCGLAVVGCGDRKPATPVTVGNSGSTLDQVCKITAELLATDRSRIDAGTSLADLGADELDFVELVMELEEHFGIAIPDETAERMMGSDNWQQGMRNVTIAKLASLVDECVQTSRTGAVQPSRSAEQTQRSMPESPNASGVPSPQDASRPAQVKVFLNPLVVLLAGAEKQKGRPLTRQEVLDIRDQAAFVMMSPEQALKFYRTLDAQAPVHRMDPDRVWEEWQEIRGQR